MRVGPASGPTRFGSGHRGTRPVLPRRSARPAAGAAGCTCRAGPTPRLPRCSRRGACRVGRVPSGRCPRRCAGVGEFAGPWSAGRRRRPHRRAGAGHRALPVSHRTPHRRAVAARSDPSVPGHDDGRVRRVAAAPIDAETTDFARFRTRCPVWRSLTATFGFCFGCVGRRCCDKCRRIPLRSALRGRTSITSLPVEPGVHLEASRCRLGDSSE